MHYSSDPQQNSPYPPMIARSKPPKSIFERMFGSDQEEEKSEEKGEGDDSRGHPTDDDDEEEYYDELTESDKERKDEEEEEMRKTLQDIKIPEGDFQIYVHIIEARDLKAENWDGTSDPIVSVETFGQKQFTSIQKSVTNCVFDELLIFNMKGVVKEDFDQQFINIVVRDHNSIIGKNNMIGAFAIDCSTLYTMNKAHEMYRQWVPLMDNEDSSDVSVQGYLKISIEIVGPSDKLQVRDEESVRQSELATELKTGGNVDALLFKVPSIRREWKFLKVTLYRCEALPVMDGRYVLYQQAGTDAYCQLEFAGGKKLKSQIVDVRANNRAGINPVYNLEFWYPVSVPTFTQQIKFSVWDHDPECSNEVIGIIYMNYYNPNPNPIPNR